MANNEFIKKMKGLSFRHLFFLIFAVAFIMSDTFDQFISKNKFIKLGGFIAAYIVIYVVVSIGIV